MALTTSAEVMQLFSPCGSPVCIFCFQFIVCLLFGLLCVYEFMRGSGLQPRWRRHGKGARLHGKVLVGCWVVNLALFVRTGERFGV